MFNRFSRAVASAAASAARSSRTFASAAQPARRLTLAAATIAAGGVVFAASSVAAAAPSASKASAPAPPAPSSNGMIAVDVMGADDLLPGEMKEVETNINGSKVLIIRNAAGKYYALSPKCPHFGAPMVTGALVGNRVLCPWHNASFSISTGGQLAHMPAYIGSAAAHLTPANRYDVSIANGRVIVAIPASGTGISKVRPMSKRDPTDSRVYAIVGCGTAGQSAAEALRQEGYTGRIVMISDEKHMPYDRIMVSKDFSKAPAPLRAAGFHDEYDIEVQLGSKVAEVDALSKTISFADGAKLKFDKAIIASGCSPRALPAAVSSPKFTNVHTLRTADDTAALKATAAGAKRVVVVGGGFIGLEAAFALKKQLNVESVTVVEPSQVPLQHVLGAEVGAVFRGIHEKNGVQFKLGSGVKSISGDASKASSVTLVDGSSLPCDFVVVAIGVQPNTDFVKGVAKGKDGSITVDPFFRSTNSSVYAAGDVARFPYFLTGESVRIEHWAHAQQCGRVAGRNAAGRSQKFETVPYFWTMQWGDKINYVGNASSFDHVHVEGSLADKKFLAYYCKGDQVLAVAAMGVPNAATYTAEALRLGSMPSLSDLQGGANLSSIQATLKKAASGCCGGGGAAGCCGSKAGEDKTA